MPHNEDFFKGFTILDDVPSFAVSHEETAGRTPAKIENFADYVLNRGGEKTHSHPLSEAAQTPKASINSFVGRLRQQQQDAQQRPPESGHYL